jgi:hypothetical protein
MTELTLIVLPVFLSAMLLVAPCKPPFLGSHFLKGKQCLPMYEQWSNMPLHLALIGINFLLQMQFIARTALYTGYVLMAASAFLWLEILTLLNKQTYFGRDYKSLEVFEKILNSCTRRRIFPGVATPMTLIQILAIFAVLRGSGTASLPSILVYLIATNNSLIVNITVFTMAGKIFCRSKQWIKKARGKSQGKLQRRVIKSFAPLRLCFKDNFADEMTCLVVQNFCFLQTVSLLLLFSK